MQKNIVLLHGWGASEFKLQPLGKALVKCGWRVLIPSIPGFNARPPLKPWHIENYASYLEDKIREKFDDQGVVVFGHSFGGRIVIRMLTGRYKNIRAGVLCSAGGLSRPALMKRTIFFILAKIGKVFLLIPPLAALFRKVLYKAAREKDYVQTHGTMKDTFKNIISEDLKKDVANIVKPTLVLWGSSDRMTPVKDAYYLIKNIDKPLLKFKIYPGIGHRLPYEIPKEISQQINLWYSKL